MNCFLEEVHLNGACKRVPTEPNGNKDHVYPSRGWAVASAMNYVEHLKAEKNHDILQIRVVRTDGVIHKTFQIQ